MAEVVLHGSQIRTLVGKVIAAGVPQHVWPNSAELRCLASNPHDVVHGLAGQR
jgi:hypothetical protein